MTQLILWKDSDADRLKHGFLDRYPETACGDSMNEDAVEITLFIKADDRCPLCVAKAQALKLMP